MFAKEDNVEKLKKKLFSGEPVLLEELDIRKGTLLKLHRAGIKTAQEVIAKTEYELMQNKYLGRKTVCDILWALKEITGGYPFQGGFGRLDIGWNTRGRLVNIGIQSAPELVKAGETKLRKAGFGNRAISEIKKAFQKIGGKFE